MKTDILEIEVDGSVVYQPIVQDDNGVIMGTVQMLIDSNGNATIRLLFVKKRFRRKKVGRRLMLICANVAMGLGCKAIYFSSRKENRGANAFYDKTGFTRTESEEDPDGYGWMASLKIPPPSPPSPPKNGRIIIP